jgi:beta-glucosidase
LSITVLDGIKEGFTGTVEYQKGCGIEPGETGDLPAAIAAIESSDASIVVVGDRSRYYGESKSTATLELMGGQLDLLRAIVATKKKFILIVIGSKPLIIPEDVVNASSAIIWQFCPGQLGGRAASRCIFGEVNPSGRLTISIPRHIGQQPCYYYPPRSWHGGYADISMSPLWSFGYGLGYSTIEYVNATLDKSVYTMNEDIHVRVTIHNAGKYDAAEVIQIYIHDVVTSVTWPDQQLKQFQRQNIKAGESVTVDLIVKCSDCWLINKAAERVVEPGAFEVRVGKASNDIKFKLGFTIQ